MANRNWSSGGKIYSMHTKPVQVDMSFTVAPSEGSGISGLSGPTVASVFMNSSSPSGGNPDPVNGTIVIRLQDNYGQLLGFDWSIQSPLSGSDVKIDNAALVAGTAYSISILGDASLAKWRAIGVPIGITPAVGVTFIAASDGGAGDVLTSRVQASAAAGSSVASIEMIGSPSLSISPDPSAGQGYGASFILQARDYAGAIVAPATGSVISISLYMNDSSVRVSGQ